MKIEHFKMERMQSQWENLVDFNLSESGVHPISLQELLPPEVIGELANVRLGYIQTNGTPELREKICAMYPGTTIDNILVTTGSAEANFLLSWSFIEPGDEILLMMPNYMQLWGLMRAFGARVKTFFLKEDLDWNPDLEELKSKVTEKTKIIAVTNPNNPTGALLNNEARETIINLADKVNAWIFADEVYQGAELEGTSTPSFWGLYNKVIVSNGLSKAYGLPGLRTGWIVAPEDSIRDVWPYHDYTTISLSALSDRIARIALTPVQREKILQRTQHILKENLSFLRSWFDEQEDLFRCVPPKAGAITFVRYHLDINSTALADRIREKKSVLLVPGDHFGMDGYLRFGFGEEKKNLSIALNRISEEMGNIRKDF